MCCVMMLAINSSWQMGGLVSLRDGEKTKKKLLSGLFRLIIPTALNAHDVIESYATSSLF